LKESSHAGNIHRHDPALFGQHRDRRLIAGHCDRRYLWAGGELSVRMWLRGPSPDRLDGAGAGAGQGSISEDSLRRARPPAWVGSSARTGCSLFRKQGSALECPATDDYEIMVEYCRFRSVLLPGREPPATFHRTRPLVRPGAPITPTTRQKPPCRPVCRSSVPHAGLRARAPLRSVGPPCPSLRIATPAPFPGSPDHCPSSHRAKARRH